MIKVLIVTTIGGFLPQFEMNDVRILQEYGAQIHYASNFNNNIYELDLDALKNRGIICHPIVIEKNPFTWKNLLAYRQIRKIIDEENIQVVHCHNPTGGALSRLAAASSHSKPKVIYTAHGLHFYRGVKMVNWLLYYPVERFLAHYTDCLITINREDRIRTNHFRLKPGGIIRQIHGVGIDLEKFQKRDEMREPMREKLHIPEGAFHIVTAAELTENKDQATVIKAIAALDDQDIYYSLCGKGPTLKKLKQLVREMGLQGRVRFLGYCNNMADILQSADCFAFPSRREGLGVAAVEALACSVPVIAADNRGTREYMADGVNGIVCAPGSPEAFSEAIRTLKEDTRLRKQMAANSRESVEHFGIADTEMRMRMIYQEIIR